MTFSAAYGSVPQLVVSMYSDVPGPAKWRSVTHTGLDAAGFTPVVWRMDTTNCVVNYMAVGLRSVLLLRRAVTPVYIDGFDGYSGPVRMVQLPAGGFKTVAASDHWISVDDGVLHLCDQQGDEIDQYGLGEYVSVAAEVLDLGRLAS